MSDDNEFGSPAPSASKASSSSSAARAGAAEPSLLTDVFAGCAPEVSKPMHVPSIAPTSAAAAAANAAAAASDDDDADASAGELPASGTRPRPLPVASGAAAAGAEVEVLQYKVAVVGNGAVGKTSLISRLCTQAFVPQYKQTLGVDLYKARIDLPEGVKASLQIWDIGGQMLNSPMVANYLYAAQAIVFVYDVTNANSFKDLEDWLALVKRQFPASELPYMALVGNKMDLTHMRAIKPDKHAKFADENNMFSFLLSVRLGDLVEVMFRRIAADLAGVVLTKAHLDVAPAVIPARLTNHTQHDPTQKPLALRDSGNSSSCTVM